MSRKCYVGYVRVFDWLDVRQYNTRDCTNGLRSTYNLNLALNLCFKRKPFIRSLVFYSLKVIPLFCTAHPLLRITLLHPRWRRFFLLARKQQTRATFAELKLLFAIIMLQIGLQLPSLPSKNKKMKEICVIPKSAVAFHFAAVELWNY